MDVLLYSSGIDSLLAREWLIHHNKDIDLKLLYFNYFGKYSSYEMHVLQLQSEKFENFKIERHDLMNFSSIEDVKSYIPNRNFLLSIMAHSLTGCDNIWIGGTKTDNVNDNNIEAYESVTNLLSTAHSKRIVFDSPFPHLYKSEILSWYINKKIDQGYSNDDVLNHICIDTFSCYNPIPYHEYKCETKNGTHNFFSTECLSCSACFRKNVELYTSFGAFRPFFNIELMNQYKDRYTKEDVFSKRSTETMSYICRK